MIDLIISIFFMACIYAFIIKKLIISTPTSSTQGGNFRFILNDCFSNCLYNIQILRQDKRFTNVKIVVGSLGIGVVGPFFEYGHRYERKFRDYLNPFGSLDAHFWIQCTEKKSRQTLIFDNFYDQYYCMVAETRGKRLTISGEQIFFKTYDELKSLGLHYVPIKNELLKTLLFAKARQLSFA
jgi:hypothetical protein